MQFPVVLTADEKGIQVGKEVEKRKATFCEIVSFGKEKKIIVFKYKATKERGEKAGDTDSPIPMCQSYGNRCRHRQKKASAKKTEAKAKAVE